MLEKFFKFADKVEFKKYFFNTSWMFLEKILRAIINLFVGTYLARYLGPSDFGILSYAISYVFIFSAIASLGLDQITVRELVNKTGAEDTLLGTVFSLKILGALIVSCIILILFQFDSNNWTTKMMILIISAGLFFQAFSVIDFYFQSKVESIYVVIIQLIQIFLCSTIKLFLIFLKAPLLWFALTMFLENLILALGLLVVYKFKRCSLIDWRFNRIMAKKLLLSSFPVIFSGVAITLYMRLDQIMIKHMLGNEAVGNYSAIVIVCESWYFIPFVVTSSLFPAILAAKQKSEEFYYARLQRLYDLMILSAITIIIPLSFIGNTIISVFFGPAFVVDHSTLQIYVWTSIFIFIGAASGKWFLAENLQKYYFYLHLMGTVINIILNLLLIPHFGINGAAISTLLSYATATYLGMGFLKVSRKNFLLAFRSLNLIAAFKRLYYG